MAPPAWAWSLAGFVGFWLMILGALSIFGGWHELSRRFRGGDAVEGEQFSFTSGAIGWGWLPVIYRGCLFATVGSKGIALSVLLPFRFLHPPLLIPWSAVERVEGAKLWLTKRVAVHVTGFSGRLLFRGRLGRRILEEWIVMGGGSSRCLTSD